MRFGKILIIEDVTQHFTASLLALIAMRIHSRFNKKMLHVGNKLIDLHEDFRLILTTSTEIKQLNGDINANVTVVPFTLTSSGLTGENIQKSCKLAHEAMQNNFRSTSFEMDFHETSRHGEEASGAFTK